MIKAPRLIIVEFLWIALSLSVTFLLAVILFGWSFVKAEFLPWLILTSLFFIVSYFIYRIKISKKTRRVITS